MTKRYFSWVLLLLSACAIEPQAERDTASDESAILGGKKVTSSDPIASMTVSVLDPSPDVGQFCTGIVVARDLVLSAAHCFDDTSRTPFVRLGTAANAPIKVSAVAVHAQYSESRRKKYDATIEKATSAAQIATPASPLYDLALLYLEAPLPSAATPVTFAGASADLANGSLVTAGFGCTSTACGGVSDVLRKVPVRFVKEADAANLVVLEAGAKKGSCFGDSGGPDFVGTKVFGMISTGPNACEAGISVDTLLAPYARWIDGASSALRAGRTSSTIKLLTF